MTASKRVEGSGEKRGVGIRLALVASGQPEVHAAALAGTSFQPVTTEISKGAVKFSALCFFLRSTRPLQKYI